MPSPVANPLTSFAGVTSDVPADVLLSPEAVRFFEAAGDALRPRLVAAIDAIAEDPSTSPEPRFPIRLTDLDTTVVVDVSLRDHALIYQLRPNGEVAILAIAELDPGHFWSR